MDIDTGAPVAILDATAITAMRTGAVTAIGARYLAGPDSRVLGHIGSRGTAYWNIRLLCRVLPDLEEIRIHSLRAESREQLARAVAKDTGRRVRAVDSWEEAVRGADVVVEATRLPAPEPLLHTDWIAPGALVIPYGTMSAVELLAHRRHGRNRGGRLGAGRRRPTGSAPGPCRERPADPRFAPCRARTDRLRSEAGPPNLGRNLALLAPRAQHLGSGCGTRYAGAAGERGVGTILHYRT